MTKLTVGVMVGSLRKDSINKLLAKALEKIGEPQFNFTRIEIGEIPHYNADLESENLAPVVAMRETMHACDALLFVTPEFNRSVPGVLKNAIDWASRPLFKNSFAGKYGAVIGASPGALGTAIAQQHLRNMLTPLELSLMGQPEAYVSLKAGMITEDGTVNDSIMKEMLENYIEKFALWVTGPGVSRVGPFIPVHIRASLTAK